MLCMHCTTRCDRYRCDAGGSRRSLGWQLLLALLSALCAGWYLAFEFLPGQTLVQPFIVLGTLAAAALLVLMNSPALLQSASATPSHLALLPVAWAFFFGLALALQVSCRLLPDPRSVASCPPGYRNSLFLRLKM